ncbi:MAG TPA: hypothetical protein VNO79_07505 [Actinomycetota bacterium]|nr:hypothetical protein [Actinomycetota bacterium]
MPQIRAALLFGAGAVLLAASILAVGIGARRGPAPAEEVTRSGYRVRRAWFVVLLVGAALALGSTFRFMPYESFRLARLPAGAHPVTVRLQAQQWEWVMEPERVPAGQPIRFVVTSRDVNHDFAIYDPHDRIIGQVQAMPGVTNVLLVTFETPGTYWIRCLELCGAFHQAMVRSFEVT